MNREEAIKIIDCYDIGFYDLSGEKIPTYKLMEAFDMAIEALQAMQAKTDGDLISRADAIRWVKTECNPYGKPTLDFESGKKVIEHLEQMPSAETPTVSEKHQLSEETPTNTPTDLISRAGVSAWLSNMGHDKLASAVMDTRRFPPERAKGGDAEIPSTEQYPYMKQSPTSGADLISRADAIEAIESRQTEQWIDADVDYNNGLESAVAEIKALPSADRPSGEWIIQNEELKISDYRCSVCGRYQDDKTNYCPDCGTKMGGE